jgi:hypothetical protein
MQVAGKCDMWNNGRGKPMGGLIKGSYFKIMKACFSFMISQKRYRLSDHGFGLWWAACQQV